MEDEEPRTECQDVALETPAKDVFVAPSISRSEILSGSSYNYYSAIPEVVQRDGATECVLGVDEAGRGPVLGIVILRQSHNYMADKVMCKVPWYTPCYISR